MTRTELPSFQCQCPGKVQYCLLADNICQGNLARTSYISNISFGDPGWEILLDLIASKCLARPTSIHELSERRGLTPTLCVRYINYYLSQATICKNPDPLAIASTPFLVSDVATKEITAWLDDFFPKDGPLNTIIRDTKVPILGY